MYNIKIDMKAHRELHNNEEDCSIIDEINAFVTIRKQAEIRERNAAKRNESVNSDNIIDSQLQRIDKQ